MPVPTKASLGIGDQNKYIYLSMISNNALSVFYTSINTLDKWQLLVSSYSITNENDTAICIENTKFQKMTFNNSPHLTLALSVNRTYQTNTYTVTLEFCTIDTSVVKIETETGSEEYPRNEVGYPIADYTATLNAEKRDWIMKRAKIFYYPGFKRLMLFTEQQKGTGDTATIGSASYYMAYANSLSPESDKADRFASVTS